MKSRLSISPLQKRKQLRDFNKTTWPPMKKKQRDSTIDSIPLVHEMEIDSIETFDLDLGSELWDLVQALFNGSPVKILNPVFGEIFNFFPVSGVRCDVHVKAKENLQWSSIFPTGFFEFSFGKSG